MAKYLFPAVFTEEEGLLAIHFPDLPGCYTAGEGLIDSFSEASDALAVMLCHMEESGKEIPAMTPIDQVSVPPRSFASYIPADTTAYRRSHYETRAVKKTLTIPAWMNEAGIAAGLNFSQILQDALQEGLYNT